MLLVTPDDIAARRVALEGSPTLRRLADRLTEFVRPLVRDPVYLPEQKALLSRDGGVCPDDGARLTFDPQSPERHQCPRCEKWYAGDRHHRAWIWRYHLWLSERAIHLALLGQLDRDDRLLQSARRIVDRYVERYRTYPNSDNVLGPTRPFFSTYLESIWLVQIVTAASLVRRRDGAGGTRWKGVDRMVRESADLIRSFNEGWSNRQVWSNAALVAAGRWLGDDRLVDAAVDGPFGVRAQLAGRVSEEGIWFEGENYHLFALRGFVLAAAALAPIGIDLYGDGGPSGVLREMFAAPLKTLLPDLTLPARGDAPYGVSVRQSRFAELWEIGWARTGDPRLGGILNRLYAPDLPDGDDHGGAELAEQEQNRRPQRLRREQLGWKALLWMTPDVPPDDANTWWRGSRLLPNAGLVILRTGPDRYVSLECGGQPGGHGHPDLLHVTLFWDGPAFADFGTGSYVTPSLHWYRSTIAHNAPSAGRVGQLGRDGGCTAFDASGEWAWCRGEATNIFGGETRAVRSLVCGPGYVVDVVEVTVPGKMAVDLPLHPVGGIDATAVDLVRPKRGIVVEGTGQPAHEIAGCCRTIASETFEVHLAPRNRETLYLAEGPGPPSLEFADGPPTSFLLRRAAGSGIWVQCYAPRLGRIAGVTRRRNDVTVEYANGARDLIRLKARGCDVQTSDGDKMRLRGVRPLRDRPRPSASPGPRVLCPTLEDRPPVAEWDQRVPAAAIVELGARHYRRSELPYASRGAFRARVAVVHHGTALSFAADVVKQPLCLRPPDAPDPMLDNEPADIHSDGLQCYVDWNEWRGYLCVPESGSGAVRVVRATPEREPLPVEGVWRQTPEGYRAIVTVDLGQALAIGDRIRVNLVVNEMYPDRERRAGQLALAGGSGWVYLRGAREPHVGAALAEVR